MPSLHDHPTDYTIVLVGFLLGPSQWWSAEEIRSGIKRLGFAKPSNQWVAGRLRAMSGEECPRFQRRYGWTRDYFEYCVTSSAATGLENTWKGFRVAPTTRAALPTPKREERL